MNEKKKTKTKTKTKAKRKVTNGVAHVVSSFNNTIISISDENGNVLAWSSAGHKGLKVLVNLLLLLHKLLQKM